MTTFPKAIALVLSLHLLVPASCPPALADAALYEIDPEHLSVGFLVEHIGYAKVLGFFREARGSFRFDEEGDVLSDLEVVVESDSVFTNHKKRDRHLTSGEFLDTWDHPSITFTAATARRTGHRTYEIEGDLELLGVTRRIRLDATWNKSGPYPIGGKPYVMGVSARGSIRRSDFGMTYALDNGWVGDEVEIIIELEARRR